MKIALYENKYGRHPIAMDDDGSCWAENNPEYWRVSMPVDVDFPPLDQAEITNMQIAVIDRKIEMLRADCQLEITNLERKKQELLALTLDSE